jgi:hypothetical protein
VNGLSGITSLQPVDNAPEGYQSAGMERDGQGKRSYTLCNPLDPLGGKCDRGASMTGRRSCGDCLARVRINSHRYAPCAPVNMHTHRYRRARFGDKNHSMV